MDWSELGEAIWTLRNSLIVLIMQRTKGDTALAAEQRTLVKAYLAEVVKQKDDPALRAIAEDFPQQLTLGGAYTLLEQMLRYWPDQPVVVSTPDDFDI